MDVFVEFEFIAGSEVWNSHWLERDQWPSLTPLG